MYSLSKLLVIVAFFFSCIAQAGPTGKQSVYKYVDAKGRVTYTDKRRHDGYVKLQKTWKGWVEPQHSYSYKDNKRKFETIIVSAAEKHEVPVWLVSAVIHAESFYNPNAISSAGAVGLMQLMPGTAKNYGVSDRQDPHQNIEGGVRYLRDLLKMFEGDLELALAAYNAGENAVKKYGYRIPPYKETQHYVRKVRDLVEQYKGRMS